MLLPNKYVFAFGGLGFVFHTITIFTILDPLNMLFGFIFGFGLLWVVRFLGSLYYKQEALGYGDVKLLGAAGLWLGGAHVIMAITVGAAVTLLHGLIIALLNYKKTGDFSIRRLKIPAGPGFVVGIGLVMIWTILPELIK